MHDEILKEVLCETAEQMFFQEFEEQEEIDPPKSVFWACIAVRNPGKFELVVAAAENEVRALMADMFPDSEELDDGRVADVVAELANTIAGSLARHLDDCGDIDLSPPGKGLGSLPEAKQYHAYASEDITLMVAVRDLNRDSPASIHAPAL